MRLITLYMPEPWLQALSSLVAAKVYPNRAEAIRIAVRDLLIVEAWKYPEDLPEKSGHLLTKSPNQISEKIRDVKRSRDFWKYFWGGGRDSKI